MHPDLALQADAEFLLALMAVERRSGVERRHSSDRVIRHLPPERAYRLSDLCSAESASSGAAPTGQPDGERARHDAALPARR